MSIFHQFRLLISHGNFTLPKYQGFMHHLSKNGEYIEEYGNATFHESNKVSKCNFRKFCELAEQGPKMSQGYTVCLI